VIIEAQFKFCKADLGDLVRNSIDPSVPLLRGRLLLLCLKKSYRNGTKGRRRVIFSIEDHQEYKTCDCEAI
jgi:hypothetical protein